MRRPVGLRGIVPKTPCNAFAVVRTRCSNWIWPPPSTTQYQLLRSPKSNPMVSFCCEKFLLCFAAAVLTFFIAGLLFICALSTSITWERTASRRRPAFSSHLLATVDIKIRFSGQCFSEPCFLKPDLSEPGLAAVFAVGVAKRGFEDLG